MSPELNLCRRGSELPNRSGIYAGRKSRTRVNMVNPICGDVNDMGANNPMSKFCVIATLSATPCYGRTRFL